MITAHRMGLLQSGVIDLDDLTPAEQQAIADAIMELERHEEPDGTLRVTFPSGDVEYWRPIVGRDFVPSFDSETEWLLHDGRYYEPQEWP